MSTVDDPLVQASSLAFAMIRFASGAAHPARGAHAPGEPRLGRDVYAFTPGFRAVPRHEVPAFLASLSSPAMLLPTTTQGIVALFVLDELSGERAAAARANLANQQNGLQHLAAQLSLTEDTRLLAEFEDETFVLPLTALYMWSERFIVDVGWSLQTLDDDPRATARLALFRSDGVDMPPRPRGMLRITSDVPVVYHTDAEMVLSALRRHVPLALERPMDAEVVHVWLVLDEKGRIEKTSVSLKSPTGDHSTYAAMLLEPFPDEKIGSFESVGTLFIPAGFGANAVALKWLQRRADITPDAANGIYQFDAQRLLPPRTTLEAAVKERYPEYARVGLTAMKEVPIRATNAAFDPEPEECVVPWFIAEEGARVVDSWLGPVLQNPLVARQMIEKRLPHLRFMSVQIGAIETVNGSSPPIVWATLEPSSLRP